MQVSRNGLPFVTNMNLNDCVGFIGALFYARYCIKQIVKSRNVYFCTRLSGEVKLFNIVALVVELSTRIYRNKQLFTSGIVGSVIQNLLYEYSADRFL